MRADEDLSDSCGDIKKNTVISLKPYNIIIPVICIALAAAVVYFTVNTYRNINSGNGISKTYSANGGKREIADADAEKESAKEETESADSKTETVVSEGITSNTASSEPQSETASSRATASESGSKADNTSVVNINTAGKEELMTLYGIGETKAQKIIDYRNSCGAFKNIEQITEVSGIGEKTFLKNKDRLTVG